MVGVIILVKCKTDSNTHSKFLVFENHSRVQTMSKEYVGKAFRNLLHPLSSNNELFYTVDFDLQT